MIQTQILKLEPPYTILICGEDVGRHIATLIVTEEKRKEDGSYGIETHSHAIVTYRPMEEDEYWSASEGVVWDKAELYQCHVVGRDGKKSIPFHRLLYFTRIFSSWHDTENFETFIQRYRFMFNTIRERIKRYGITIDAPPKDAKIRIQLYYIPFQDRPDLGMVGNIWNEGFSFRVVSKPDLKGVAENLMMQVDGYQHMILGTHKVPFLFWTEMPGLKNLCDTLNKKQGISE